MHKDLFEIIEEQIPHMSKSHKKIAAFLKNSGEIAAYLTATRLGVEVGVSESTVVRFAIRDIPNSRACFSRAFVQS